VKNSVTMGNAQNTGRNETDGDEPHASSLLTFTREDEMPLFGNNIQTLDPAFIDEFRILYSSNDEAIPLDFRMCVFMVSVDEIENRGLYLGCPGQEQGDVRMERSNGLKLPVGVVHKYNQFDQTMNMNNDFLGKLWDYIQCGQWNHLRQACPNLKCGVCAKTPVLDMATEGYHSRNESAYKNDQVACIPVCTNDKCWLIANKCNAKVYESWASATGFPSCRSASACANCERWNDGVQFELLECSRCNAVSYCNTECQRADWPKHKNACTLVNCQHCEKLETSTKFPTCGRCKQVFYCGEDCQRANWPSHKNLCNS
jgi:hypothetical protein